MKPKKAKPGDSRGIKNRGSVGSKRIAENTLSRSVARGRLASSILPLPHSAIAASVYHSHIHAVYSRFFALFPLRARSVYVHVYACVRTSEAEWWGTELRDSTRGCSRHRNDAFRDEDPWNDNQAPPNRPRPCSMRENPPLRLLVS